MHETALEAAIDTPCRRGMYTEFERQLIWQCYLKCSLFYKFMFQCEPFLGLFFCIHRIPCPLLLLATSSQDFV
jgi:hypothetical protein